MTDHRIPISKATRALFARLLFVIHGLIAIWRVVVVYNDAIYWLFTVVLMAIFAEGTLIIFVRRGNENRWFCSCIFLYMCATVPSIWFLQLELSPALQALRKNVQKPNVTTPTAEAEKERRSNLDSLENAQIGIAGLSMNLIIPKLDNEVWLQVLQQTMLVTVILGRWILPKGDITRDQLSQLLLMFLAMAADIVELFDTFKEEQVKYNLELTFIVLIVWTVSLMQFALVLTGRSSGPTGPENPPGPSKRTLTRQGTKQSLNVPFANDTSVISSATTVNKSYSMGGRSVSSASLRRDSSSISTRLQVTKKPSLSASHSKIDESTTMGSVFSFCKLLAADMSFWGIVTSTFLQDGPYLATRLYLLIVHKTNSMTMIFFTCKNVLVVVLSWYRLLVISCELRQRVRFSAYYHRYYSETLFYSGGGGGGTYNSSSSPAPLMKRKDSVHSSSTSVVVGTGHRRRTGANVNALLSTLTESEMSLVEDPADLASSNASSTNPLLPQSPYGVYSLSTFGKPKRPSFGSLSATAVPYYFSSMSNVTSYSLTRQHRSLDDDSGIDIYFSNDTTSLYL